MNKRHYEHTLPNIRGSLSNTYDDVWIGCGVRILCGVHIDTRCIIGANSLVNKSVDSFSIYGGVPAKKIKSFQ